MNMIHAESSGYTVAGKNARVLNADAHQLITILFEELLNLLDEIRVIQTRGETSEITDQQVMALSIVDSLIVSLDMENGGEVAANLRRTYGQVRALIAADNPTDRLKNCQIARQMVAEIHDAWMGIGES
ncbi:flagellar export chaperone FliS [Parasphingorhabdus litoris]|uniref:Flagellar export chaperone FliS n=1 Tax=Parasphingorhabdus litoris TaxID=394733 RepID=A0ABN1A718_9SPHN|nr:flagellar export chaperone FliS [Parasphingorhabdus litoris]